MRTRLLLLFVSALLVTSGRSQSTPTPPPEAAKPAAPAVPSETTTPPPAPANPAVTHPAAPQASDVAIKDAEPAHATIAKTKDASGKDTLSVDFPDEDIRNILRNVADLFELNLIIPETLQGKASIKLRDVSWRQIYQSVLDPVGYTYIEEGNIIKVVSKESLNDEPVATEVFVLNYARAADVLPTLNSLVDTTKGGKIVVDARSNSLVITERPSRMNRIRPIIEQLDHATDQVMIESKFVEVTDQDTKNLGVNWSSLSAYTINAQPTQLTVRAGSHLPYEPPTGPVGGPLTYTAVPEISKASTTFAAVFSATQFQTVLSALQTKNKTKVVSNPTVVTLNNTEATINVGEEYPIPNYAYSEQTGTFQISGFTFKPIGVILKVTPQVNTRGFIKLTLSPEVSQRNGSVSFGGASATQIPIIATRKATTQVSLKDGYTMGIGGLLTQNVVNGDSKVPVLGSIPFVGQLFRSNSKDKTQRNLIIFITAKSMSPEGASVEKTFSSAQVAPLEMTREELPGYRDGADPFVTAAPTATAPSKK